MRNADEFAESVGKCVCACACGCAGCEDISWAKWIEGCKTAQPGRILRFTTSRRRPEAWIWRNQRGNKQCLDNECKMFDWLDCSII